MKRLMWLPIGLALAGCVQGDRSPVGGGQADNAGEKEFKESMALSAYPQVEYRDLQDNKISFEEFMKQMRGGKTFSMLKLKNSGKKVAVVSLRERSDKPVEVKDGIEIGSVLPELQADTLDGKLVDSATLSGRHTLLSFFYAECVPCIAEVPALNAYAKAHPEMGALAVTFDEKHEAQAFVRKHGLQWPVVADGEAYIDKVGVTTYPTVLLIGPDRKIVAKMGVTLLQREHSTASAVAALEAWVKSVQ